MPLVERLGRIAQGLGEIVDTHAPDLAALESPFYHRNPRSLIALAQARGAILAILALRGLVVEEYSPAEVKSAITGSGRADKGQVARMVALTLSLGDEKLPADATDALAVAICCAQRLRMDRFRGPGRGGGREG
jgi:crossover junction endodeoxyribonuclease RuvC